MSLFVLGALVAIGWLLSEMRAPSAETALVRLQNDAYCSRIYGIWN